MNRRELKLKYPDLYEKGYKEGPKSRQHADQFIQERWNKKVLNGGVCALSYFEFKAWEAGYWNSRHDYFWGLGIFSEEENCYDD